MESFDLSQLLNLLKKPPKSRSLQNLGRIQFYLKNVQFFEDLNKDLAPAQLAECLKYLHSKVYSGNDSICVKGELIDKVFIVVHGKVVFEDSDCKILKSFGIGKVVTENFLGIEPIDFDIKSFSSQTILVYYTKEDYKRLLGKYREGKKLALVNFLSVQKVFLKWPKCLLISLASNAFMQVYQKGETLYERQDTPNEVFILHEGELMIMGKTVSRIDSVYIFGLEEMRQNERYNGSCMATRKSKILVLSKYDAMKIIQVQNQRYIQSFSSSNSNFRTSSQEISPNIRKNSRQRLVSTSLRWGSRVSFDSMVSYSSVFHSHKKRKVAVSYTSLKQL